jgi:hypothetical protein
MTGHFLLALARRAVHPVVGGTLLAGLIYGITFLRWGGGVRLDAERPPAVRSARMEFVLASVTLSFNLTTAFTYEGLREEP